MPPTPSGSTTSTAETSATAVPTDRVVERTHTVLDSPIGTLTLVAEDGALTALLMEVNRHGPRNPDRGRRNDAVFGAAAEQLQAYFAGELTEFDLPLAPEGTAFQLRVWDALRDIPYGETRSYGQIARSLGTPGASRAVGLANGHNPISIIVPCHRVIGADGSLTGYGGGLERKQYLLDHERRMRGDLLF